MAVLSGRVKICIYSIGGKELMLNIIDRGGLFGEIAVLDGQTRSADAVAIGNTELLVLERRRLMPFLTHDPEIASRLERTVTIRDGRVGGEGRYGTEYAVIGRDGSVQLPSDVLDLLPPDSLVRVLRRAHGVELHRVDDSDPPPGSHSR